MEPVVVGLQSQEQARIRPVPTDLLDGATVHDAIKELLDNYHDINPQSVTELQQEPTPLEFMRFVSRNQPFIVRNNKNPIWCRIRKTWSPAYLCQKLSRTTVTVALTPQGNADAVVHVPHNSGSIFCKPHELHEPFPHAVSQIIAQETTPDYAGATRYIQSQNDNLRSEYRDLFSELPATIPWATQALEQEADAVNFWLGNSHSTSVLHKDHYENLFVQLSGSKEFVMLPPVEAPCVNEKSVLSATYHVLDPPGSAELLRKHHLGVKIDEPVQYIPLPLWDPDRPEENTSMYSVYARPVRVTVNAGDMLYLPALWYHKVKQISGPEGICCSVNYWYDMDFTGHFQVGTKFVQEVALLGPRETHQEGAIS